MSDIKYKKDEKYANPLDEKWIDYLEKEMEDSLIQDLDLMLARDNQLKKQLHKVDKIKQSLKQSDVELPTDDLFFKRLESKIMSEVEKTEMDSPLSIQMQKNSRQYVAAAAVTVIAGLAVWISLKSLQAPKEKQVAKMRKEALIEVQESNDLTDTIITHEDANDFLLDAAAKEMEKMSPKEMKKVLEETTYK